MTQPVASSEMTPQARTKIKNTRKFITKKNEVSFVFVNLSVGGSNARTHPIASSEMTPPTGRVFSEDVLSLKTEIAFAYILLIYAKLFLQNRVKCECVGESMFFL